MSIFEIVLGFLLRYGGPIYLGPVCGAPWNVCPPHPAIRTRR